MPDTGIAYGAGNAPGLPPINLPSLGDQQAPLRIEVTKTGQAPQPAVDWTPQPWAPAGAAVAGAPTEQPQSDWTPEPWTPPKPSTPEREVGGGEAGLRGLAAGASFEFEPAIVGAYQGAKTGLGFGEPGKTAGQAYDEARQAELEQNARAAAQHPYLYHGGEALGTIAPMAIPGLGVGRAATTIGRIVLGTGAGTVGGTLTGAGQAVSEGQSAGDVAKSAALGGAVGAPLGLLGGAAVEGAAGLGGKVASLVRGARNPEREAQRVIAEATLGHQQQQQIAQRMADRAANTAGRQAGTDVRLVDYLGAPGTARARSAANINPEARELLGEFVQGRYHQQGSRIGNYLRSRFGAYDTEADRNALEGAARKANRPNYRNAEAAAERRYPNGINSPELERLASGDIVPTAMHGAARSARDRAIAEGGGSFGSRVSIKNGVLQFQNRRGVAGYPDLRFWDYTQRELQDMIGAAQRAGRNEEASRLISLRRQLVDELDQLVPEFKNARGVAARFFKAGDASEAGERFVTDNTISNATAARAVAKMSAPERALFARAFAARVADLLERANYSANALNNMFVNSPRAVQRIQIALGPAEAGRFEALLRVEGMIDRTRRAVVGNSTTAQQGYELGTAAGAAGLIEAVHGAINPAYLIAGGLMLGGRQMARGIDQQIALRVAEMLLSRDPSIAQRGLDIAARNPVIRDALRKASNIGVRELINAAGPSGVAAGAGAATEHFTRSPPEIPRNQGGYDEQYDNQGTGGTP